MSEPDAPILRPPPLRPGDRVALVAQAGPFDREAFELGVAALRHRGYVPVFDDAIFAQDGFLAGSDARRSRELQKALDDDSIRAVIAARGGYGATRLLPAFEAQHVRRAAKWLVGFSDITALHALWARARVCSVHGMMVAKLGTSSARLQNRWFDLLEGAPCAGVRGLQTRFDGVAEGTLIGGNLAVLSALLGTPFVPPLRGSILFLEDVGERPYRVDRMLTSMTHAGWFAHVRGVVLGAFTDARPGPDGVTCDEVLRRHFGALGVPAVSGFPAGHIVDNRELLLGARVRLDATEGELRWL